ncbi:probable imidazolonepropionase [Diadema antillarum]|uniref:probable imidazolonepropionase n=1 Tax=Diadema antillarum TaxID=105358 RepID=UPI003A8A30F0
MASFKLCLRNARQVVQVCSEGESCLVGEAMKKVAVIQQDGDDGVDVIVDREGQIAALGHSSVIQSKYGDCQFDQTVDCSNMCVIPGLIDGHTHPVWAGDRVHEFAMKLAGASYMDVHKAGGGIHFTVNHTRSASEDDLYGLLRSRLTSMLHCGTTTVECKSGYGLDVDTEVKMLRVLERARRELPIEISSTYCGAHAIPKGMTVEEATQDVIDVQLPRIKELMEKGELKVENIDVFCDKGIFEVEETRRILEAGTKMGMAINFHGDELHPVRAAELGAELKARAISHLEEISEPGMEAMAQVGSVAVLLPTTAYILRLKPPPARQMISKNVPIALGSDFNPNAYCLSMPLTMHLACVIFRMSLEEALVAATINAAKSLGRSQTHGSLEVGKVADMLVINAPRWEHFIYQMGCHQELLRTVIKGGAVVYSSDK